MLKSLENYIIKVSSLIIDISNKNLSYLTSENNIVKSIWKHRKHRLSFVFPIIMIYSINAVLSYGLTVQSVSKSMPSTDNIVNALQFFFMILSFVFWLPLKREELLDKNEPLRKINNDQLKLLLRRIMIISNSLLTTKLVMSIAILVSILPGDGNQYNVDLLLLWDAYIVWASNTLIFATWYWLLYSGQELHFLFPIEEKKDVLRWKGDWKPNLIDFWFLAFTASTAFSPTDTTFLSRRSKVLMIFQSSLSLVILTILAARAVNILKFAPPP